MNYHLTLFFLLSFSFNSTVNSQIFSDETIVDVNLSNVRLPHIKVANIDDDRFQEIFVLGDDLVLYDMDDQGQFTKNIVLSHSNLFDLHDFNNDGYLDIIRPVLGSFQVYYNDGQRNFSDFQTYTIGSTAVGEILPINAFTGDFHSLIFTYQNRNDVNLWKIDESSFGNSGMFPNSINTSSTPRNLRRIDVDNDGFDDLVYSFGNSTYWYKNNADRWYTRRTIVSGFSVEFHDYNNDGNKDVHRNELNAWIPNDGDENWLLDNLIPIPQSYNGPATSFDVDLDGDIDIIKADAEEESSLIFYNNNGLGTFSDSPLSTTDYKALYIHNSDINSDGANDLLIAAENIQTGEIFLAIRFNNLNNVNTISGCIFYDRNNNNIKDKDERSLEHIKSQIESENWLASSNEEGCYSYFVENGTYKINYVENQNWVLSSDSASYTISVDSNSFANLDFGFVPRDTFMGGIMHAVSGITRCNRDTKFDFTFKNLGTTVITEGTIFVFQDSLTEIANEINPIDTLQSERVWGWTFENLHPGESIKRSIELSIPGLGGDIEPGTLIEIFSVTEAKNTQDFINFFKNNYSEEILCAYDPNDKLISPKRQENENYTQFGDTLIYTVRFQNTGNDTAFNVVIRDTLDSSLEVSTFNIINSSHRRILDADIQEGRFVTFNFENILLPDSTINFNGSQGYVTYSIQANDGLKENTEVTNTASIFFDFNPPIVTNTTLNTMVTCLPIEEQFISATITEGETYNLPNGIAVNQAGTYNATIEDNEGCPFEIYIVTLDVLSSTNQLELQDAISIAPNPCSDNFMLNLDIDSQIDLIGIITDPFDKKISTKNINATNTRFAIDQIPEGVYFLQIQDSKGVLLGVKKFMVID